MYIYILVPVKRNLWPYFLSKTFAFEDYSRLFKEWFLVLAGFTLELLRALKNMDA